MKRIERWWWEWGEGDRVVVMVHGWGRDKRDWLRLIPFVERKRFKWVMVDLPGFGSWQWQERYGKWGSWQYADWLAEEIEKREGRVIGVVGHSWGGKIGVILAARYPSLVERLVLIGAKVWGEERESYRWYRLLPWWLKRGGRKIWGRWVMSDDYRQAGERRELFLRVVQEDARQEARRVKQPSLLVWGKEDKAVKLEKGKELATMMPQARLVVYQGGHDIALEKPRLVVRQIERFLDE